MVIFKDCTFKRNGKMSVRNQYARNNYKIAPMPLTSNQLVNARNAVRRRNMYRAPEERDDANITGATGTTGDTENKTDHTEVKSDRETVDLFQVRKNDRLKKGSEMVVYGKHELNKLVSKSSMNNAKDLILDENKRNKTKSKEIKADSSSQRPKNTTNNVVQSRPKSARPDSRWERRVNNEVEYFSDEELENKSFVRPISARPDSRTVRLLESENNSDCPDRPKTSHGRRKSIDNYPEQINRKNERDKEQKERPKSRRSNMKEISWSSDESVDTKLSKDSNYVQLQSKGNDSDIVFHDTGYHVGISTFYPDLLDKIHGTDDINVQIDDIDRDVDPVLFFMQDNGNKPETNSKKRTSLSKEAISFITNENNSRHSKAAIGFQGNNLNKRNSAPEVIDRFHRNKVLSLQNSIADDNQRNFNHGRHERIKSDSFIGNSAAGENICKSRTNTNNVDTSSPPQTVPRKRDIDLGKQSSNYDGGSSTPQKYNIATTRKPRKLKPLSPSCLEE